MAEKELCIMCGKDVLDSPLPVVTTIKTERGQYLVCFNCFTFTPKEVIQKKILEIERQ